MSEGTGIVVVVLAIVMLAVGSIGGCMRYAPEYNVWSSEMEGKAELAKADQNRQIKIAEAKARLEAAKLDAEAEVARAKGTDEANKVLMQSLGGPENYLRWRYIQMLEANEGHGISREVIYTPAGGMFPITEAGRAVTK